MAVFVLEVIIDVLPATMLAPMAFLGSMFSAIGATEGCKEAFHPFGILGLFDLAGFLGLWLLVPQNAFQEGFSPGKSHLALLSLGIVAALPIAYVGIFVAKPEDPRDFYFIVCLVGPVIISVKYLYSAFKGINKLTFGDQKDLTSGLQ